MDVREMAKYIDREALVEWLKRIPLKDLSDGRGLCRVIFEDDFKRAIKKIPKGIIVDVAPVRHGCWERVIPSKSAAKWSTKVSCSNCHSAGYAHHNYCPNCGAKMEGSVDNEAVVGMSESGKTNVGYTTLSDLMIFEQADIGKTVFLTREAAEEALEAMKE